MEKTTSLKKEYMALWAKYKQLYPIVKNGNQILRNHKCVCGSGKKWKSCCLKTHEENQKKLNTIILEMRDVLKPMLWPYKKENR